MPSARLECAPNRPGKLDALTDREMDRLCQTLARLLISAARNMGVLDGPDAGAPAGQAAGDQTRSTPLAPQSRAG